MIDLDHRDLQLEQAELLRRLRPTSILTRAAHHGRPFRLQDTPHSFSEAVVLSLVDKRLLRATQITAGWPGHSEPCPFSVIITPEGEKIRAGILSGARQPNTGTAA